MSVLSHGPEDPRLERVEHLLHAAARLEPDLPPPPDLVRSAVRRVAAVEPTRMSWVGSLGLGAAFAGAGALVVVLLSSLTRPPTSLLSNHPGSLREAPSPIVARSVPTAGEQRSKEHVASVSVDEPPSAAVETVAAPVRTVAAGPRSRRTGRLRIAPPPAQWAVQAVNREHTGILTQGWLVEPASEHGEVFIRPGVVELPLGDVSPASYSTGNR